MNVATRLRGAFAIYIALLAAVVFYHVRTIRRTVASGHTISEIAARHRVAATDQTARAAQMDELQRVAAEVGTGDAPGSESTFVARLSPTTRAQEGVAFNIWLNTHKLHLFDAKTGRALGR